MLKSPIIHPLLLSALAKCGHKAQILIADANYSVASNTAHTANIVYLNFAPGTVSATAVLTGLIQLINVECTTMLAWPEDFENTARDEYLEILPSPTPMELVERDAFYSLVKSQDTVLVIATGETRRFANLLITVGSVIV